MPCSKALSAKQSPKQITYQDLKGLDTFVVVVVVSVVVVVVVVVRGTILFYNRDNFCDFLFAFLHTKPLLRRGYSKRKEFAPMGEQILSF